MQDINEINEINENKLLNESFIRKDSIEITSEELTEKKIYDYDLEILEYISQLRLETLNETSKDCLLTENLRQAISLTKENNLKSLNSRILTQEEKRREKARQKRPLLPLLDKISEERNNTLASYLIEKFLLCGVKWKTVEDIEELTKHKYSEIKNVLEAMSREDKIIIGFTKDSSEKIICDANRYKTETKLLVKLIDFMNQKVIR